MALVSDGESSGSGIWTGCVDISIVVIVGPSYRHASKREIAIILQPPKIREVEPKPPTLLRTTHVLATLSTIESWLRECLDGEHPACNKLNKKMAWLPTRLLDCDPSRDGLPRNTVRVTETASFTDEQKSKPYLTLSHCWGRAECLKLTTSNYDRLVKQGISKADLPQLYRDCVLVMNELGFRYVWIDSLCIIQEGDSGNDWKHEVTQMNQVYLRSFCNIAAADAPDGNHSLFTSRDPSTFAPGHLDVPVGDGRTQRRVFVYSPSFWKWELESNILNSRAWVLQERVSSPCVLYFGKNQLLFECQEFGAAEIFPRGIPMKPKFKSLSNTFKGIGRLALYERERMDFRSSSDLGWRKVVEVYTQCKLTYGSDKLPAFGAIAKMWSRIMDDEYVAGLWRYRLEDQLVWHIESDGSPGPRPKDYRAPSWSWAAVDGKVVPGPRAENDIILVRVLDLELELVNPDDIWTSRVSSGWLKLQGFLVQVKLERKRFDRDDHIFDLSIVPTTTEDSAKGQASITDFKQEFPPHGIWFDAAHDGNFSQSNADGSLFFMPVWIDAVESKAPQARCLLLQLCDREAGTYIRLGVVIMQTSLWRLTRLQKSQSGRENFPCEEFRDSKHIIQVI